MSKLIQLPLTILGSFKVGNSTLMLVLAMVLIYLLATGKMARVARVILSNE